MFRCGPKIRALYERQIMSHADKVIVFSEIAPSKLRRVHEVHLWLLCSLNTGFPRPSELGLLLTCVELSQAASYANVPLRYWPDTCSQVNIHPVKEWLQRLDHVQLLKRLACR